MIAFDLLGLSIQIPIHARHAARRLLVVVAATLVAINVAIVLVAGLVAVWGAF